MEDGMCPICLLLIFGIPASGKTVLARSILSERRKPEMNPQWTWLAIHFDDFYPLDTRYKMVHTLPPINMYI